MISQSLHKHDERKVEFNQKIRAELESFGMDVLSSTKRLTERFNEVEVKEMQLRSDQESVAKRFKEVERKEKDLENMWKDVNVAKKGFVDTVNLWEEKLNNWEKKNGLEYLKEELKETENNLKNVKKDLLDKEKRLDKVKKEVSENENSLVSVRNELSVEENRLDIVVKELRLMETDLDYLKKEYKEKKKELDNVMKEFKEMKKNLEFVNKEVREKESELEECKAEADNLDTLRKQLESKEEELSSMMKEIEKKQNFQDTIQKKLDLKEEQLRSLYEQRMKDVMLREERVKERIEALGEKEKQLTVVPNADIWMETSEAIAGGSAVIRNVLIMDGKDFQIFLNENENKLDLMCDGVFKALQMSTDPAQLVLDAMEGFYPPHLTNGKTEFTGSVVRRSCLLLLEQLLRLSPKIGASVREEATNLAREWKVKMKATDEILGFLYLLASFNSVSAFDAAELIFLLKIVAKHDKFAELCRSLGMEQKIPCFIQNLIDKKQWLVAFTCIYEFDLVNMFSPVLILKNHVNESKEMAKQILDGGSNSHHAQMQALECEIYALKESVRHIVDRGLQSEYPPCHIQEEIAKLELQMSNLTQSSGDQKSATHFQQVKNNGGTRRSARQLAKKRSTAAESDMGKFT